MEIKELRAKTGLSQTKFSEKYGIPVRTIQDWEAGLRTPSKYVIDMLTYIIANENVNHIGWVFYECREKLGIGHQETFKEKNVAVNYAKDCWKSLDQHTKESFISDPAAVFFVAELRLKWNPYAENFYPDLTDAKPVWDALAKFRTNSED